MKVKRIKELADRIDTIVRVFVEGKDDLGVALPINRQDVFDKMQYFDDDYEFPANVVDKEDDSVLTKLFLKGGFDNEEN